MLLINLVDKIVENALAAGTVRKKCRDRGA